MLKFISLISKYRLSNEKPLFIAQGQNLQAQIFSLHFLLNLH